MQKWGTTTTGKRRWRYELQERQPSRTHKRGWGYRNQRLRAAAGILLENLPYLFVYVRYPQVPRTTNHVEGGINARIRELMRRHRGLSLSQKQVLIAWYLLSRQTEKPTRNVT